jgi:peptidoglycan hydrolase-like protein with peptidoglycan-binding domain
LPVKGNNITFYKPYNMNTGPILSLGSTGSHVKRLQRILVMKKMLFNITGTFDATTKARVIDFQLDEGLAADGIVGPATWHALPADPNTPLLNIGSNGTAVTALQKFLKRNSPPYPNPGAADGHFGALTKASVKAYQTEIGVTADGIVGDKTWWASAGAMGATLASLCGLTSL